MKEERRRFGSYEEFYAFYLTQHSDARNRAMHAVGTTLGVATAVWAVKSGRPWRALLGLPVAYGFAWCGHLLLEGNVPATFGHPGWSFVSDWRMLWEMARGRVR